MLVYEIDRCQNFGVKIECLQRVKLGRALMDTLYIEGTWYI